MWAKVSIGYVQRVQALTGLARRSPWAFADQLQISLSNFLLLILLARGVTPAEFGLFVLIQVVLAYSHGVQNALITQPHNVIGGGRSSDSYLHYTRSTALSQFAFVVMLTLLSSGAFLFALMNDLPIAGMLGALVPTLTAVQVQEFVRRVFYTEDRLREAVANGVVRYGVQTVVILMMAWSRELTGATALAAVAVTAALASIIGAPRLRNQLKLEWHPSALNENLHFGKWLVAATTSNRLSTDLYSFLLAAVVGPTATAGLRAATLLLGPLQVALLSLNTLLPIMLSRTLIIRGPRAMRMQLLSIPTVAGPAVALYGLGVTVFADRLLAAVFGSGYAAFSSIVGLVAAYYVLVFAAQTASSALRATRQTRAVFLAQLAAAVSTLTIGVQATTAFGIEGAAIGMLASILFAALITWSVVLRSPIEHLASPPVRANPRRSGGFG